MRRRRGQYISWERFQRLLQRYPLPAAQIVHSCYAGNDLKNRKRELSSTYGSVGL